jgi:hypothetical protein
MIIGLAGHAGSGKSTAADFLCAVGFERRKFALPLKSMVMALLVTQGCDDDTIHRMIEGDLKEVPSVVFGGKSPRYVMQTLGTDWGRALLSESIWADAAMRSIKNDDVVFDDVRFWNEAEAIRSRGGIVIMIRRPVEGRVDVGSHISESFEFEVDATIENNGSKYDLARKITEVVNRGVRTRL